jgi:hypothetical protein
MLLGYLTGLIVGFTAFDPDTDIYALLGAVLALIGVLIGLVPFFRGRLNTAFGILIGFYLGMVIVILIWGDPQTDDLLEFVRLGDYRILIALVIAGIGGFFASRFMPGTAHLPALAFLLGGFLGGALFIALGVAPASSMVGVFPFVIGSGLICALAVRYLTNRRLVNRAD